MFGPAPRAIAQIMTSSIAKPPPPPPTPEHRRVSRQRVLLSGRIVYNDGAGSYNCAIRDLSSSGARLGIRGATVLPKYFYLLDLRNGTAHESEVVWRNATQTGVRFHGALALADLTDPKLRYLRNLYVEACLR